MWFELWEITRIAGHIMAKLWWYVLIAITIASMMSTLRLDTKVAQYLHRARVWAITGALLLGIVSPL